MDDVYGIVNKAKPLKIKSFKQVIARMAQQTVDCGYFICSYAKDTSFCMMTHFSFETVFLTRHLYQGPEL
jgi:hypothetical protein